MSKIAPSVLAADFSNLRDELSSVSSADYLHVDIMDGNFVPNFSMGFPVLEALRRSTQLPLDVHLMIERPLRYIRSFASAGADIISIHLESDNEAQIRAALQEIRACGKKAGLVIKPGTNPTQICPFLSEIDLVLVMTVEPGTGGQPFRTDQLPVIRQVRDWIKNTNPACELEVDGGITLKTIRLAAAAGADVFVSGTGVFGAKDRAGQISALRNAVSTMD